MTGSLIRVTVRGQGQVVDLLEQIAARGQDLRTPLADIGAYLERSTDDRFRAEQDPDGNPWEPLADATLLKRARKGVKKGQRTRTKRGSTRVGAIRALAAAKILRDSGLLHDTLAYQVDATSLRFGSNLVYAATHQFGDDRRNIPARPYLGFSDADLDESLRILQDWLLPRQGG